jgi:2-dehydro-3-deoxyphosphogluconate aldolase / (4S)-4-hydroxy-2-oxoglutarate aldolase
VPNAVSVVAALSERFGERALVGAGTVLNAEQARACLDAGARFIVSPGLDLGTVEAVRARDVAIMPGALTPTEVMAAAKAGADMIKIFPCGALGGAPYLRALRGPLPQLKLLPTGGVSLGTAREYITAGAVALGVGTELVDTALLVAGQDHELTSRAKRFVEAVRSARETLNRG